MRDPIKKPPASFSAPAMEREVLKRWKKEKTFESSLKRNPASKRFTFYDGPPFATGLPHYGHLLQGTIKDVIPRFKTMQGYHVERRFGWDCHGLPVEYELEKDAGIKSRQEILEMGVDRFNEACRAIVLRHAKDFEAATDRIGRWVDFKNDYKTMDPDYMESIWWVVKTLWEKDLLYEGRKSMHICPRCATPLSNFEVSQGYRDRKDPAVYVKFPLVGESDPNLIAWTTTPWTLPANVLLAINPDHQYVEVRRGQERFILAEDRLESVFPGEDVEISRTVPTRELVGQRYEPLFPVPDLQGKHYEVVADTSVTSEEGTGILHVAPAFGEDDMRIGKREKAALIQHITLDGKLTAPFDRYHGMSALEANQPLVNELKQSGQLLRKETITHSYPHCWRCETPLLNFALTTWFVAVTKLKDRLVAENRHINWTPAHIRDGRFGQWLAGARDWAISRNRFWGNPMPIWRCGKSHLKVVGSLDELEQLSGVRPKDLHKHFVDKITFPCPDCDGEMSRIEDVLDCWFESGSMPYGARHYPFEHSKDFDKQFPADFIAEGVDQTRGWFYTLHVLGVALKDSRAYDNVVTTGLILAEDGKKMSKSLKNYPDPAKIFDTYGADALRLYMMLNPIVRGDDLRFSEKGVEEVMRNYTLTLWNTYSFFATYAAVDQWIPQPPPTKPAHIMDRWILLKLDDLVDEVTSALDRFDLMTVARTLNFFLDSVSNWYVRQSRRRFWKSQDDTDKQEAFATLYEVLTQFCRLAAPVTPFISEHIFTALGNKGSVHLEEWPVSTGRPDPENLLLQMRTALQIVPLGLAARSKSGIKVRQPLPEVRIALHGKEALPELSNDIVQLLRGELNVKSVTVLRDDDPVFSQKLVPIPKKVAAMVGKDTQEVISAVKNGQYEVSGDTVVSAGKTVPLDAFTTSYVTGGEFEVESNPDVLVALDTKVSRELADEGLTRELIRHIQELRKSSGLAVEDRISLTLESDAQPLKRCVKKHQELIAAEVLARSLELKESPEDNGSDVEIEGNPVRITIKRV